MREPNSGAYVQETQGSDDKSRANSYANSTTTIDRIRKKNMSDREVFMSLYQNNNKRS